jgi:hypothetical protein
MSPEARERYLESQRSWYRANRERVLADDRMRVTGFTPADWSERFDAQGGLCAICHRRAAIHADHCHDTGQKRSLLCSQCNTGLGSFGDDSSLLEAAAAYLREFKRVA